MHARYRLARHRLAVDARSRQRKSSRGFTLIEMLIAMVLTLLMVWAIAEFYARVGEAVKDGRAMIDQRNGLRTVTQRLHEDLSLHTVVPAPPIIDSLAPGYAVAGQGYLTIFEGAGSDADPEGDGIDVFPPGGNGIPDIAELSANQVPIFTENNLVPNLLGDVDDYLGLTIRSANEPFTAQAVLADATTGIMTGTGTGTANLAEVAWWTSFKDNPLLPNANTADLGEVRSIHRRLLLIRPEVNMVHSGDTDYSGPYYFRIPDTLPVGADYHSVMQFCDVSVRPIGIYNNFVYYFANSLADLTRRENRFLHVGTAFPHPIDLNLNNGGSFGLPPGNPANVLSQARWVLRGTRRGEDVMLSNVLTFDVRLFDATAPLLFDNSAATLANPSPATGTLQPGDVGFGPALAAGHNSAGQGAYVDLNYNRYVVPPVPATSPSRYRAPQTTHNLPGLINTYCTWAASYERDGVDQDLVGGPDQGTNGIDDDLSNGVDDKGGMEQECRLPYPFPLRGLEVKVRTYEPGTRQVQQGTVSSDFIPE